MLSYTPDAPLQFCFDETLHSRLLAIGALAVRAGAKAEIQEIGPSRAGRPMWGIRLGDGPGQVSITAGAHADEPVGPMTALALCEWLIASDRGARYLQEHTFHICPQVNPDGAEANRAWFADPPDPLEYFKHSQREAPGEDIEFGYPRPEGAFRDEDGTPLPPLAALRPENQAVADFLTGRRPFVYHASLHGMGLCEGAWFLIGAAWAERSDPLRRRLREISSQLGLGFHDIDRAGDKGFTRIAQGFSTTPTHTGMRAFFHREGDADTADLFHPNSMEWVSCQGGDPLVMVSELPLFTIGMPYEWSDPPRDDTPSKRMRSELPGARAKLIAGDASPILSLLEKYSVRPTPLLAQIRMQGAMILAALDFRSAEESRINKT